MEKDKKIRFKKNLPLFLMIFIPYVCFSSFKAILEINDNIIFVVSFLLIVCGVSLILIILLIIKGINLKEQENTQFTNGKNIENASEKSPEPILYRISLAGKDIKFSMIFSIIILVLDILLLFTLHNDTTLWSFSATFELISYIWVHGFI